MRACVFLCQGVSAAPGSDREQTVLLKKGVDRGALLYIEGQE